ncbi:hypothetical protein BT96DRAFT_1017035 [Gymnopus androsaceus JB14]|uniref:DUF1766-domain-containing protein n=1 Tax=Gymnopus androsaceus JB14 TaxID=1447944 RepID=A0A6A4I367_9AGAR|nr:hypothetical protein BT96DRAFT_1017035 [Gymnopus androsaceus JB14]
MGTGYKLKGKAINLFAKFKSNDSEPVNNGPDINSRISPSNSRSSSPTKSSASGAPPKGPRAPGESHPTDSNPVDTNQAQLAQSLDALNLNENPAPRHRNHERYRSEGHLYTPQRQYSNSTPSPTGQFIGGFNPTAPQYSVPPPGAGPGPLPRPPAMQFPTAAMDGSLTMQYAQQPPAQPPAQLPSFQRQLLTPYGGYGAPPSRPYSAPAPPGFPHPASSPYPSPYPSPGSSPAHTPNYPPQQYLGQAIPSTSTPNFFPGPHPPPPHTGRPLPSPAGPYGGPNTYGAPPLPSSPTRPTLTTQFNSPSAGPTKHQGRPGRPRASSTPPTPTAGVSGVSGQIQCSGVTKAGKRCTRLVKGGPALVSVWGATSPTTGNVERFCHQHAKELLGPSGFYARKQHRDGRQGQGLQEWIDFADYIPPYLHPDTQVALRVEMEKPRSQSDVEGFIYTFEVRDPKDPTPPTISLKVGRAVNVVKRLNQWGKQCGSKEQVLRGWYPGEVDNESDEANDTVGQSLMKGRVKAGGRGVWCHRLERLIHLELADLAVHAPYLQPGWDAFSKGSGQGKTYAASHPEYVSGGNTVGSNPSASASVISISSSSSSSPPGSPVSTPAKGKGKGKGAAKSKAPAKSKKDRFLANGLGNGGGGAPCKDCGQIHKEIFEFPRVPKGPKGKRGAKKHVDYYGLEWEGIVKKVVDEWGAFVANYV